MPETLTPSTTGSRRPPAGSPTSRPATTGPWRRAALLAGVGAVSAAAVAGLLAIVAAASWSSAMAPAIADPADLLLAGGCAVGALLAAWLGVSIVASAMAQLPGLVGRIGTHVAEQIAPTALRRTVALALGTSLLAALAPGTAAEAARAGGRPATSGVAGWLVPTQVGVPTRPAGSGAPDPGFRPVSPTGASATSPAPPTTPPDAADPAFGPVPRAQPADPASHYLVRAGDSLWGIAARHLGAGATTAQIAAAWPRWYAANRAVIGPDPDQIEPGQRLVLPSAAAGARPEAS